jgi:pentatricopeptide repeat protein
LKSPSGEGNLTCEQALSAHCSAKCTNGALELLRGMKKGK